MWNAVNTVMGTRPRRRRNGMGTFTAMVVGAGVGIAAWETLRRTGVARPMRQATTTVQDAIENIQG